MDTEMTCYESFAEVTEDFYCSAVDVLKILVLRLHDYHARCFHSLRDALYDYFSTDAAPHTHANVSTKHAAFKEYSASVLDKTKRPSVLAKLHDLAQSVANLPDKVRHKQEERGL